MKMITMLGVSIDFACEIELKLQPNSVITNKNNNLVGLGHFYDRFSRL